MVRIGGSMKKLILALLLIVVISTPVHADDLNNGEAPALKNKYQGMWACMSTKYFGYRDGEIKHYRDEKFIMKVMADTITFSHDDEDFAPNKIVLALTTLLSVRGAVELFQFDGKKYGRVSMSSPEATYTQIGTCEKFDDQN
jgi:hypothetical protein